MRRPSEYLSAALAAIRDSLMPDCSESLVHGGRSATATRVGSYSRGGDALTDSGVSEAVRVLASAAAFPELSKGSLVSLSGAWRIVTDARTDPAGATLHVGLSAPLGPARAAYRRPGTHVRQTVDVLAVEGDALEPASDAFAPTTCRQWLVAVAADGWFEPTEPQMGDELTLAAAVVRVAEVARRDGHWILTCRARR